MTVFFAAGNQGSDGTPGALGFCTGGDGVVDPDSADDARHREECHHSWGLREPAIFGRAERPALAADQLLLRTAAGSNRHPFQQCRERHGRLLIARADRRRPRQAGIVAPGTNIVSDKTHAADAGPTTSLLWGAHETNPNYAYSGGTSMATPLTAGVGTLVRQWLTTHGLANPSAAAVKATLLDTTADMAPGQYGTGTTQEVPFARPNNVTGWGRADLAFMNAPAPYALWVDDHSAGLATNDVVTYAHTTAQPLQVLDSSQPLRVVLAWTDPPASLSASAQLVNDLDLVVNGPGGPYYGNNISTGDRINNVEGVIVNNPPIGQYTVQVRAHNVPIAAQPYALAVGGPLASTGQLSLAKTASPVASVAPGGLITYTLALGSGSRAITQTVTLTDTLPANTTFVQCFRWRGADRPRQRDRPMERSLAGRQHHDHPLAGRAGQRQRCRKHADRQRRLPGRERRRSARRWSACDRHSAH